MEIEFFEALRAVGVPDDTARATVGALSQEIDRRIALHTDHLARRTDVAETRAELTTRIDDTRAEVANVRTEVANVRADVVRWVAGMLVAQTAVVITAVGALLKLVR